MLAFQAGLVAAALAGAVGGLRLREPHPTEFDPHRGYRPPVGDDPIYWREFELPRRGRRVLPVVVLVRRLLILLRILVLVALQVVALAIAAAMLIGTMIAGGWFGVLAFRETWGLDAPPAGPVSARDAFNGYIRLMSFMMGVLPMMVSTNVAGRIAYERDKKTWEPLLMTPMTGAEILASKRRVMAISLRATGRGLVVLWLVGIVCGALHPAGAVLAALGYVTGVRLGLTLGLRAAIRPGATTRSINASTNVWSLALMVVGGCTIVAPLCSPRDLGRLRDLGAPLPWLGAAVLLALAIAMAAWERSVTRRCTERFDEWVGRPHRSSEMAGATGIPAAQPVRGHEARPASSAVSSR
jgi:hypothetical protein